MTWTRAPLNVLAGALCGGLTFASVARVHLLGLGVCLLAALGVVASHTPAARLGAAAMLLFGLGWWWASARLDVLDRSALSAQVDRAGRFVVVVTAPPTRQRYGIRTFGRVRTFEGRALDEPVRLEFFGVELGLPNSIAIERSSTFAMTDIDLAPAP